MYKETETFYGFDENDLENQIHHLLDQPNTIYKGAKYYRDEEGDFVADVTYTITTEE